MRINESLKLVVPLCSDDKGPTVYAYHTPISREVFEANYRVLAATKSALASGGIRNLMGNGPVIASLTLKDEAMKDAVDRGENIDEAMPPGSALLAEISRLTVVLAPGPEGWETLPVHVAIKRQIIDEEDWQEAESAIVFFTCLYALARKAERDKVMKTTTSILDASTTSLSPMEFVASLPTLTTALPTAAKAASSVPS